MRVRERKHLQVAATVFGTLAMLSLSLVPQAAQAADAAAGRKVVTDRSLGNCAACHVLPDVESPGDIGPDLTASMEAYGPEDRATVRQWIWDPREFNPHTIMPPFGANKILTPQQVDDVVEYLYSLNK
jgi:sulfur oxidation c-type cytochrome SoxX